MVNAVIVDAVRTPGGKRNGRLSGWHPVDLSALTLNTLIERNGIDPAVVDDVIIGCVGQVGAQGFNIARNAVLAAGFPETVPATTVDRQCGSSQQSIHFAAQGVMSGSYDVVIAGGVEAMSLVPLGATISQPAFGSPFSESLMKRYDLVPQGISAEMIAEKWSLSREELDLYSLRSHQLAAAATEAGHFKSELIPLASRSRDRETGVLSDYGPELFVDEGIRADTTLERLSALKPAFKADGGKVTAGNSSQITDGAAAVLIMSEERAAELGCTPRARVVAMTVAGADPVMMLTAPIPATENVLRRAGLRLADIDLVEINEAFASVVLAWERELHPDMTRVNVSGGAIALGHPLGASGAKLMATLVNNLERTGGRYGLQTMCEGGGMANATIIERLG
jgi:acetyl-CoA acyltransferase